MDDMDVETLVNKAEIYANKTEILSNIKIKLLDKKLGTEIPLPQYSTNGSAGLDLRACIEHPIEVLPNECTLISFGIAVYIENPNLCGMILPRSGLGHKHGIVLGNLVGLIDSDYQGELKMSCWNRGNKPYEIQKAERIAQLIIVPKVRAQFEIVDDFTPTNRNVGGFGHTGKA